MKKPKGIAEEGPKASNRKPSLRTGCLAATGITLGIIMTGLIVSWDSDEKRRCVDANNVVVAEEYCTAQDSSTSHTSGTTHSGFFWYYGGSGHTMGTTATGGGYVSRGGFGSSSSSHASAAG
jgi:hypothetical protein